MVTLVTTVVAVVVPTVELTLPVLTLETTFLDAVETLLTTFLLAVGRVIVRVPAG